MRMRLRIERLEQAAKPESEFLPDCICFPAKEPPFFGFPIEREIAARVKCPLHGERFVLRPHIYAAKWRRQGEKMRRERLSPQYHKAWNVSFPPELWPAEEEETGDGAILLKLKDGTRLLAVGRVGSVPQHVPQQT